ncbi:MAG: bacillithiol system redox-active protein YtxJ [Fibrobacteria bacterium]
MNEIALLHTEKQAEAAMAASSRAPVFIFKHSTHCGVSTRAIHQFRSFAEEEAPGLGYYQVDVIESRAASDDLELMTLVRHASPQVLLIWNEECVWHASHGEIQAAALHAQAEKIRDRLRK